MKVTFSTSSTQKVRRDAAGGKRGEGHRRFFDPVERPDPRAMRLGAEDPWVTSVGGLAAFGAFVHKEGIDASLAQHFDGMKAGASVVYPMSAQLRLLLDAQVCGEPRVFGLEALSADPLFVHLSGGMVPSLDTVYRDLERFETTGLSALERLVARQGLVPVASLRGQARVHLDIDSTVLPLFGEQEAAAVGPNPRYHGRPSYHPLLGVVAETGTVVGAELRPGDTGLGGDDTLVVKTWLARVRHALGGEPLVCARIDAAGDCTDLMRGIAAERAVFVIKAKMDRALRQAVTYAPTWTTVDEDGDGQPLTQVAEVPFERAVWREQELQGVRVIAERTRLDRCGKQLALWDDAWTVQVFFTHDATLTPDEVREEYNGRAEVETWIRDLKQGWSLGAMPSRVFAANHALFLVKLLGFNVLRRYAMRVLPAPLSRWRTPWLRRVMIRVAGRLVRSARRWWLRLSMGSLLGRLRC
jgi:hypothetical protein